MGNVVLGFRHCLGSGLLFAVPDSCRILGWASLYGFRLRVSGIRRAFLIISWTIVSFRVSFGYRLSRGVRARAFASSVDVRVLGSGAGIIGLSYVRRFRRSCGVNWGRVLDPVGPHYRVKRGKMGPLACRWCRRGREDTRVACEQTVNGQGAANHNKALIKPSRLWCNRRASRREEDLFKMVSV
ncbi:MAG: hypothetical protein ACYSR6_10790 [Planctomycetota bacterium]